MSWQQIFLLHYDCMVPKVDTFEGDIAEEIKRREASMTKISAASNDVGNDEVLLPTRKPIFLIFVIVFLLATLAGFGYLAYFYLNDSLLSPKPGDTTINPNDVPKTTTDIKNISQTLSEQIGRFVTRIEKKDQGYILTISEYSPVFAYMTRNEKDYIEELSLLFSATENTAQATTTEIKPVLAATTTTLSTATTSTSTVATTTKPKTSTQKTASTTPTTSTTTKSSTTTEGFVSLPEATISGVEFSDVTISNQNMRVWKKGGRTVVYAFVGNNTLLISHGTAGIMLLKNAILR